MRRAKCENDPKKYGPDPWFEEQLREMEAARRREQKVFAVLAVVAWLWGAFILLAAILWGEG